MKMTILLITSLGWLNKVQTVLDTQSNSFCIYRYLRGSIPSASARKTCTAKICWGTGKDRTLLAEMRFQLARYWPFSRQMLLDANTFQATIGAFCFDVLSKMVIHGYPAIVQNLLHLSFGPRNGELFRSWKSDTTRCGVNVFGGSLGTRFLRSQSWSQGASGVLYHMYLPWTCIVRDQLENLSTQLGSYHVFFQEQSLTERRNVVVNSQQFFLKHSSRHATGTSIRILCVYIQPTEVQRWLDSPLDALNRCESVLKWRPARFNLPWMRWRRPLCRSLRMCSPCPWRFFRTEESCFRRTCPSCLL